MTHHLLIWNQHSSSTYQLSLKLALCEHWSPCWDPSPYQPPHAESTSGLCSLLLTGPGFADFFFNNLSPPTLSLINPSRHRFTNPVRLVKKQNHQIHTRLTSSPLPSHHKTEPTSRFFLFCFVLFCNQAPPIARQAVALASASNRAMGRTRSRRVARIESLQPSNKSPNHSSQKNASNSVDHLFFFHLPPQNSPLPLFWILLKSRCLALCQTSCAMVSLT